MTHRYALRMEDADGTVDEPYLYASTKREAFRLARIAARHLVFAVAVWVDDTKTDLGVKRFPKLATKGD